MSMNNYKQISLGYGSKQQLKTEKKDQTSPGPIYNNNELSSMSFLSRAKNRGKPADSSFGNGYEKWDKVQYRGAEHLFYGRESPGPGVYEDI